MIPKLRDDIFDRALILSHAFQQAQLSHVAVVERNDCSWIRAEQNLANCSIWNGLAGNCVF